LQLYINSDTISYIQNTETIMFHVKQNKKGDNMAIKKERKTRVVTLKTLTKAQKIADEINSLVVGERMWSKAVKDGDVEESALWRLHVAAAKESLRDMGIPMGWRLEKEEKKEVKNLPTQQNIPFD